MTNNATPFHLEATTVPKKSTRGGSLSCSGLFDPPTATEYTFLSLGAGVQSSCLALMAAKGEVGPMPHAAIFSDTQGEPREIYEWLDYLEPLLPYPVYRVTRGSLEETEMMLKTSAKSGKVYRKAHIPAFGMNLDGTKGIIARKCTRTFKIEPYVAKVKELASIKRGQKEVTVTTWLGISRDELQRMKEAQQPWAQARWPLIELGMTRRDCLDWMKANGYPEPPRSACVYCPFHSDHEWRKIRDNDPKGWQDAINFEKRMQAAAERDETLRAKPYLHPSLVPLEEVDLRTDRERGQGELWDFMAECEGMCGV